MKGFIEEIGVGHKEWVLPLGLKLRETKDRLMISNGKPNIWVLSLFTGYEQLGVFNVKRPHKFKERVWINLKMKDGKIVSVN